jgi:hypothetical protein
MSNNPWNTLPFSPPYTADGDARDLAALSPRLRERFALKLDSLPEPFHGFPAAPVLLLGLNPGFKPEDYKAHGHPAFVTLARQNLRHEVPFYLLHPDLRETPGGRWWRRTLKPMIRDAGEEAVSRCVCCIEFFGYHSAQYRSLRQTLPSQRYGFGLVGGP